jgi:hypothetical protein
VVLLLESVEMFYVSAARGQDCSTDVVQGVALGKRQRVTV